VSRDTNKTVFAIRLEGFAATEWQLQPEQFSAGSISISISISVSISIIISISSKGKVHPITGHEGREGSRGIFILFL
jgi:hypothetical protein